MTLREFASLLAICTRCGKRGGHHSVLDVIECECGNAWRGTVPLCFEGPATSVPSPLPAVAPADGPSVLERVA